jgi:cytochrome c2
MKAKLALSHRERNPTMRAFFILLALLCGSNAAAATAVEARAREAIQKHGCAVCHRIPGIASPGGGIGPSLEHVTRRAYIAGSIPNRREAMARWLQHPQELRPGTLMPDTGVTEEEARDIVAWLYARS